MFLSGGNVFGEMMFGWVMVDKGDKLGVYGWIMGFEKMK